ncbi:MAG: hypothetical protein ACRC67_06840 [Inquilinus sp.]|uniref:hypothetical protein n=1 Tax=Inquilinus sp. TaxID=1932117 RepID=UPI003F393BA9
MNEQLAKQVSFYADAERRHRRSASRSTVWGGVIAVGAAATGAAGIGGTIWTAFAALRSWRESTLDREKAERYRATWGAPKVLSGEVDMAKQKLAQGDTAAADGLVWPKFRSLFLKEFQYQAVVGCAWV